MLIINVWMFFFSCLSTAKGIPDKHFIQRQFTVEVATWFCIATLTRWILTCLCWTSSGHRKLAATYLLSLCIYLRSCCLTWKSLRIALYSMFWAWQLYLWICFTGKQWMPLIQKTFQSYIGRVRTVKKGCFTWDFTCDMFHVELHYFRIYLWYNDSKTWFSLVFCCTIWNLLVKVLKIPLESSCGDAALL